MALRISFRLPRSHRQQSLCKEKTRYDKTVTFLIRTHMSTEKENRAAEPPDSPAGPLLRYLQCKQSLQNRFLHVQKVDCCSKEKFRKLLKLEMKKGN